MTYGTYADVKRNGDIPPRMVAGPMSLEAAQQMVRERGFGYCAKPF